VFGRGRYTAEETFRDIDDNTFHPELHYFVGGNSKVYGAALFRLASHDFDDVVHSTSIAPAWPITYNDLEPFYVQAEHLYWVHGKHGEDPFAGTSSQDYRYLPGRTHRGSRCYPTVWRNSACTRSTCPSGLTSPRTSTAR